MKTVACSGLIALTLLGVARAAEASRQDEPAPQAHGVGHKRLYYIP